MFFSSWSPPFCILLTPPCVHHTTMHQFTVSFHSKPYIRRLNVHLVVTCHRHFWQNDRDLLPAAAVTREWNGDRNKRAQKVDPGEENSPAVPTCRDVNSGEFTSLQVGTAGEFFKSQWNLSITRSALYHWTIPAPGDNYDLFLHKEQNVKMTLLAARLNTGVSPVVTVQREV